MLKTRVTRAIIRGALVRYGARPTCATPEPGWSWLCLKPRCLQWRTGFPTFDAMLAGLREHRRDCRWAR